MLLDKPRARRAIFPAAARSARRLSARSGRPNRLTRGGPVTWAVTALLAALTTACFGATASGPDDAVDAGAAGHDASPKDAHEAGPDARGHEDATRTGDARAADAAVDATTLDASVREASPSMDAGPHDATQHVDAIAKSGPPDAGHDSTAADADAAPLCAYPDASTRAIDILAEVPGVTIQDFDIDSANVFFTTSTGGILSCPATGCAGTAMTVWPSDPDGGVPWRPNFLVRIGLGGLVFAESVQAGVNLYALARDGSDVRLLQQQTGGIFPAPEALTASTSETVYEGNSNVVGAGGGGTWLAGVSVDADGGTHTSQVPLAWFGEPGFGGYRAIALAGSRLYAVLQEDYGGAPPLLHRLFLLNALADGGAPTPFYATSPITVDVSGWSFAASTTLVAAAGTVLGDGGVTFGDGGLNGFHTIDAGAASGLFVCPAGATCASATKVEGVDAKSITALCADATTLYFTDTSNDLFSCDGAAALAGSCTPKLLSCPVPPFSELRSNASYVYLLKSDGSAIVRIAR